MAETPGTRDFSAEPGGLLYRATTRRATAPAVRCCLRAAAGAALALAGRPASTDLAASTPATLAEAQSTAAKSVAGSFAVTRANVARARRATRASRAAGTDAPVRHNRRRREHRHRNQDRSIHTVSPREKTWLTETNAFKGRRATTDAQTSRQTQGISQSGWTGDQFRQTQYRHWSRGRGISRKSSRDSGVPHWHASVVAVATTSNAFSETGLLAPRRTRPRDCSSRGRRVQRQGAGEESSPQFSLHAVGEFFAGQQGQPALASADRPWE